MNNDNETKYTNEISAFLKNKRSHLSPLDVGLPGGARRRIKGLRREEVAALAGVGVTWYTWLEQGRDVNVSDYVLDRISQALRLSDIEKTHLFFLVKGRAPRHKTSRNYVVPRSVQVMMEDISGRPAFVFNIFWDVLLWNQAAASVFGFLRNSQDERPNMLRMLFLDSKLNSRIKDWDTQAPLFVASFRRDYVKAYKDSQIDNLLIELQEKSPLFKSLWQNQSVEGRCRGKRSIYVSGYGYIDFLHTTFIVDDEANIRLALYVTTRNEHIIKG